MVMAILRLYWSPLDKEFCIKIQEINTKIKELNVPIFFFTK